MVIIINVIININIYLMSIVNLDYINLTNARVNQNSDWIVLVPILTNINMKNRFEIPNNHKCHVDIIRVMNGDK